MILLIQPMVRPLNRWAEHSQQVACRNAMVASTHLAARRRERTEVQEYLEHALADRAMVRAQSTRPELAAVAHG